MARRSQEATSGLVLALLGVHWLHRTLSSMLFHVNHLDASTFALVPLLLATVALVACWLPARRASLTEPMAALRQNW